MHHSHFIKTTDMVQQFWQSKVLLCSHYSVVL